MMKSLIAKTLCFLATALILTGCGLATSEPQAPDMTKRAEELKNLRWGMFVCWSLSTFSGKEWTPGVKDVAAFKATEVDTDQWARTAKEAEMGYILFLTKHHDGFCLWDTKTTDRKVTKSPLGRDVLAELRKSCDKYGIKLALYFSEGDWTWPGAKDGKVNGSGQDAGKEREQLTELLSNYGPIEFMWVDHAASTGGLSHQEFLDLCRKLQPGCFVGFNHGDQQNTRIHIGECGRPLPPAEIKRAGDTAGTASAPYLAAEFTYPIQPRRPKGAMWFYSDPANEGACVSVEKLLSDYRGAVKCGNIFSIDVGPDYKGKLRKIDVETLRAVGEKIRDQKPEVPSLAQGKPIKASSEWDKECCAAKANDGDTATRWGAARGTKSGWLEIDLTKEESIASVQVFEPFPRAKSFSIEVKDGETWRKVAEGTVFDGEKTFRFEPLKTRYVRLNILAASDVPSIEEFRVYSSEKGK